MAKLSKTAKAVQKEFLPMGTEIAILTAWCFAKGLYPTARLLQQAQDQYGLDVANLYTSNM